MYPPRTGVAVLVALVLVGGGLSAYAAFLPNSNVNPVNPSLQPSPQVQTSSRTMVLDVGPPGSADSVYARSPFVLRDTDGSYKMWYSGYDGSRNRGMYATSPDGIHWTKHGVIMDVLTAPYNWDSVGPMNVIKIGSVYQGWFAAGYWTGGVYGYWAQIYHATSTDGITWNVTGVALPPSQTWDAGMTNSPSVVRDSHGTYWMSFFGWDGSKTRLGIATSANGSTFVPYAGDPILSLGPAGSWDSVGMSGSSLLLTGSSWTMWYDGWDGNTNRIGVAHSSDGFNWTKDAGNPVVVPEPSPAWDDASVLGPDVLTTPDGPVLYFVGSGGTNLRIGLDTLAPPPGRTMVLDVGGAGSADSAGVFLPFVLHDTDGSYKMWYTGNSGNHDSVQLATSMDGVHWTKLGVVMDVSNGAGAPFVLKIGATYHMWFIAITWCCSAIGYLDQIYHTTSTNGVSWTTPVLAVGVGPAGSWSADTVSEPWIIQDASGVYRMYYAGWNDSAIVEIGVATSTDLLNWTQYSGNPVLPYGAPGSWDSRAVVTPSVVRNGNSWIMYYAGNNATQGAIGRTFSADGYHWTNDAANPVIGPGLSPAWDSHGVGSADLVTLPSGPVIYYFGSDGTTPRIGLLSFTLPTDRMRVLSPGPAGSPDADAIYSASVVHNSNGNYTMYYTGLAGGTYTILRATSPDGLNFTKQGALFASSSSDATPFVLKVGPTYHIWYEVVAACGPFGWCDQIYSATSSDGFTWTQQGLVLGLGPSGAFDDASVSDPHVVDAGNGTYRMYYTGTDTSHDAEIGMAASTDLLNWTRYGGNPVLPFGASGAWDNAHVASPSVALTGSIWTMYYYAFPNGSTASIGRATSTDGLSWTRDGANPVITPEPAPGWDDTSVAFPDFSVDGFGAHLYYRGSNATSSSIGVSVLQATSSPAPLILAAAASPTFAETGQVITFTCTASGGISPYTYAWTFGDGTTGSGSTATHAYSTAGTYPATCTVTDSASSMATGTTSVTITSSPSPVTASASASPSSAQTGQTILFLCSASGGSSPYSYTWAFGDGSTGSGATAMHAYSSAGGFTAICTVTDAVSATSSASTNITVVSTSSQPVPLVDYVSGRGYVCPVPVGWSRAYNVTSGGYTYDLFLQGTVDGLPANMLLDTVNASGAAETSSYMTSMLNMVVHGVQSSLPDAYLAWSTLRTVSHHLGVAFEIDYSSRPIVQYGLIVVSDVNARAWSVILTGASSASGTLNATFSQVVQGFQVTVSSSPPPSSPPPDIFVVAQYLGVALVVLVPVIVAAVYFARRRRPSPGAAAPVAFLTCPSCGGPLVPGAPFCGNCGARIGGGPPPPPGSP